MNNKSSSETLRLLPIFSIVFVDLLGFAIVIPLIALYGVHFQATHGELAVLGSSYSFCQFIFSPFWGSLSDRIGRRPILLFSILGSVSSYLLFAYAESFSVLLLSRALAGVFAANISTAHAYAADVSSEENRARAMGFIGAAIGLGFTIGPAIGGLSVRYIGLSAPGFISALLCSINFIAVLFYLPESLPKEKRTSRPALSCSPFSRLLQLRIGGGKGFLSMLFLILAGSTFAFSHMEQAFSLFLQLRLTLDTAEAGFRTGLLLLEMGVIGVVVQARLIRPLTARFGERNLLKVGLFFSAVSMLALSFSITYWSFALACLPIALGGALINPSLSSLISKNNGELGQGTTFGLAQSLGSLARIFGPFSGLYLFGILPVAPFLVAGVVYLGLFCGVLLKFKETR